MRKSGVNVVGAFCPAVKLVRRMSTPSTGTTRGGDPGLSYWQASGADQPSPADVQAGFRAVSQGHRRDRAEGGPRSMMQRPFGPSAGVPSRP